MTTMYIIWWELCFCERKYCVSETFVTGNFILQYEIKFNLIKEIKCGDSKKNPVWSENFISSRVPGCHPVLLRPPNWCLICYLIIPACLNVYIAVRLSLTYSGIGGLWSDILWDYKLGDCNFICGHFF